MLSLSNIILSRLNAKSLCYLRHFFVQAMACLYFFALCGIAAAQTAGEPEPVRVNEAPIAQINSIQRFTPAGGDSGENPFAIKRILTRFEFWTCLMVFLFGAIVIGAQFLLLRKKDFDANDLLKVFGITLIVVGTLFSISTGRSDQQTAPAMGLFGTLAGYLLGKATTAQKIPKEKKAKNIAARSEKGAEV